MLSEISQTEKAKHCLYVEPKTKPTKQNENRFTDTNYKLVAAKRKRGSKCANQVSGIKRHKPPLM